MRWSLQITTVFYNIHLLPKWILVKPMSSLLNLTGHQYKHLVRVDIKTWNSIIVILLSGFKANIKIKVKLYKPTRVNWIKTFNFPLFPIEKYNWFHTVPLNSKYSKQGLKKIKSWPYFWTPQDFKQCFVLIVTENT